MIRHRIPQITDDLQYHVEVRKYLTFISKCRCTFGNNKSIAISFHFSLTQQRNLQKLLFINREIKNWSELCTGCICNDWTTFRVGFVPRFWHIQNSEGQVINSLPEQPTKLASFRAHNKPATEIGQVAAKGQQVIVRLDINLRYPSQVSNANE